MLGAGGRSWNELAERLDALKTAACQECNESSGAALESQNRHLSAKTEALEASRERFALLYDFAPVGYVTLDRAGHVEEMNLTAAGMLKGERDAMLQRDFAAVAGIEDPPAFAEHLARSLRERQSQTTELRARPGGG